MVGPQLANYNVRILACPDDLVKCDCEAVIVSPATLNTRSLATDVARAAKYTAAS